MIYDLGVDVCLLFVVFCLLLFGLGLGLDMCLCVLAFWNPAKPGQVLEFFYLEFSTSNFVLPISYF
jgi:hypothetical protein